MSKTPIIYTALEFYRLPNGNVTHHIHYVAACTQAQAIEALRSGPRIDYNECWITSDQVREQRDASVMYRAQTSRVDEISPQEYTRWKAIQCRPHMTDGELVAATFDRVCAPRKSREPEYNHLEQSAETGCFAHDA